MAAKCLNLGPSSIGTKISNMGNEAFDTIVSTELGKTDQADYMLKETEKQLKKKYPKVYDGTNQDMIPVPPQYDFGVTSKGGGKDKKKDEESKRKDKARAMQFGNESLIKGRIAQLEQLQKRKAEDEREKAHLQQILRDKLPLSCEANVVLRFRTFFENEPGLCLHSFSPTDYLLRYIELARVLRKYYSPKKLLILEESILRALNLPAADIDQWVADAMKKIETESLKINSASPSLFTGQVISTALDLKGKCEKERKSQNIELKKTFPIFHTKWDENLKRPVEELDSQGKRKECYYSKTEVIHKLYKSEYERLINSFNDEFDCLIFLAKHRLILGIEAKQAMTNNPEANDNQAKEAAKQVKKREEYIRKTFGELLDKGWRYVKIIALYDHEGSIVKNKCPDCAPYILTNGTDTEQKQQMIDLMAALTSNSGGKSSQTNSGISEFQHIFSRLVGLSALFMAVQKVDAYHNIMGTDAVGINAGWTKASKMKFGNETDLSRFGDMVGRPHDIIKLIFFNPDQAGILALKHKCVVFLDDYGAGKSLILKEASIRMSKRCANEGSQKKRNVFYISLLASDKDSRPRNAYFTFDLMSKLDMKNTKVKVVDVHDLVEEYKKHHNGKIGEDITVYELVDDLINHNLDGDFFMDECPFPAEKDSKGYWYNETSVKRVQAFIEGCRRKVNNAIWFAFQANALNDSCGSDYKFDEAFKQMKENLANNGVFIRSLNTNMRNTSEIGQVTKKAQFDNPGYIYSKLTKNIQSLEARTQTSSSQKPTLILYLKNERGKYIQKVIQLALEKKNEETEATVFMFDETEIEIEEIKKILISCGEDPNKIVLHPEKSKKETTQQFEIFLKNPQGIYLVPQDCFTGTEARSVIFLLSEKDDHYPTSVRCHLSRAISNLIVIQELRINENSTNYLLPSMEIKESFLKCSKETKEFAFKCPNHESKHATTTKEGRHGHSKIKSWFSPFQKLKLKSSFFPVQEDLIVCRPCWIVCHKKCEGRKVEKIYSSETKTCSCCSMTNCLLQK